MSGSEADLHSEQDPREIPAPVLVGMLHWELSLLAAHCQLCFQQTCFQLSGFCVCSSQSQPRSFSWSCELRLGSRELSHPPGAFLALPRLPAALQCCTCRGRGYFRIFQGFSPWFCAFLLSTSFKFTHSQFKCSHILISERESISEHLCSASPGAGIGAGD